MNLVTEQIGRLFEIRTRFGKEECAVKKAMVLSLSQQNRFIKNQIKVYFDLLLFIMAYPDEEDIYNLAAAELKRMSLLVSKNTRLAESLSESGIPNTCVSGMFSFEMIKWMRVQFPKNVKSISIGADERKAISILTCLLGEAPTEILQEGYIKWKNWIKGFAVHGKEDILDILIKVFDQAPISSRLKEELWNDLQIVVSIGLDDQTLTRGSVVSFAGSTHYQKGINKVPDVTKVLDQKPVAVTLTDAQKEKLIALSRMTLVCYQRETDPVTYTSADYCRYYSFGNGLTIALMGLRPDRRQPIDTYIGYMAFKNGIPIAYGGGWILFDSCRIGVNVFPSFRGGESSLIFTQILGVYRYVFSINRFTVDPYQIGKNNSDGIKSGAFWMYYRMGFRPTNAALRTIADREFTQIQNIKNYRSSAKTLAELANSKLEFIIAKQGSAACFDATDLSILYQKLVKERSSGNLAGANKKNQSTALTVRNKIAENWYRILAVHDNWKNHLSEEFLDQLLSLKAEGDEYAYIKLLQKNSKLKTFFNKALKEIEQG